MRGQMVGMTSGWYLCSSHWQDSKNSECQRILLCWFSSFIFSSFSFSSFFSPSFFPSLPYFCSFMNSYIVWEHISRNILHEKPLHCVYLKIPLLPGKSSLLRAAVHSCDEWNRWKGTLYTFPPFLSFQELYLRCCFCSAAKFCLTLCDPMDCSMPGFPVHHYFPEFAQINVHWVGDAIQPSHPLSPSSPALNPSMKVFSNKSASGGQNIGASASVLQ